MLSQENVRLPVSGRTYSVNTANRRQFPAGIQQYLDWADSEESGGYSSRYIGSLVADFHRTLVRGGAFLYPQTRDFARDNCVGWSDIVRTRTGSAQEESCPRGHACPTCDGPIACFGGAAVPVGERYDFQKDDDGNNDKADQPYRL